VSLPFGFMLFGLNNQTKGMAEVTELVIADTKKIVRKACNMLSRSGQSPLMIEMSGGIHLFEDIKTHLSDFEYDYKLLDGKTIEMDGRKIEVVHGIEMKNGNTLIFSLL